MDADEFRAGSSQIVEYIISYLDGLRREPPCPPLAQVQPGYLEKLLPALPPQQPEKWDDVFKDVERVIMPGVAHWHSPHFHAYFPTSNSFAAICGDILSDGIGCIGFSWIASPACTELETYVMDWLGKMIDLPKEFLSGGKGGGIIQSTASEVTYNMLLTARTKKLSELMAGSKDFELAHKHIGKMVLYCSDQAHSSVEKAALIDLIRCHKVESDDKQRMRGDALRRRVAEDRKQGLIPLICVASLGTTPSCAFDNLQEIGPVCKDENMWFHVDAAYAGSFFICPEFQHFMKGCQLADSFNFNPHKRMEVNFDCSALWLKDSTFLEETFNVDPVYLRHSSQEKTYNYRHWQIALGRRFRALKLWFVIRLNGVQKLQDSMRRDVRLALEFENFVMKDARFEIFGEVQLGLVCFRLKGDNDKNKILLELLTKDGRIYLVPSEVKGTYFLRFAICATSTTSKDVVFAWNAIREVADAMK